MLFGIEESQDFVAYEPIFIPGFYIETMTLFIRVDAKVPL
jgi:hypothetical protein